MLCDACGGDGRSIHRCGYERCERDDEPCCECNGTGIDLEARETLYLDALRLAVLAVYAGGRPPLRPLGLDDDAIGALLQSVHGRPSRWRFAA